MTDSPVPAWRCVVCGYIHHGAQAPEACPLCGAPAGEFEPFEPAPPPAAAAPKRWRCIICGYIHEGPLPPGECPLCGAPADCFEPEAPAPASAPQGARPGRAVIVGAGIAGVAAAEALRAAAPEIEITLVSRETELPYCRINLSRYLAGEIGREELPLHPASWYRERRIELLLGAEAAALDLEGRAVRLEDGRRLPWDKLILTAGAHTFLPPLPGVEREGVRGLRTLEDAEAILAAAGGAGRRVVIVGGGILGLEAAGALARRGAAVTVLEGFGWLLPRQLNRRAGEILAGHVAQLGITLRPLARTRAITGDGRALGVALESGDTLPADLVVVATGIRCNTHLARQAGLTVNQGIIVDDQLRASHPDVLAAGDVAEHRGVVYGLWGAAQFQGRLAGMNAAGGRGEFGGLPRSNALKVLGIEMFSIGRIDAEDGADLVLEQEDAGAYLRFLIRDGRLAGAILLGNGRAAGAVKRAVESRLDLSGLLLTRPTAAQFAEGLLKNEGLQCTP